LSRFGTKKMSSTGSNAAEKGDVTQANLTTEIELAEKDDYAQSEEERETAAPSEAEKGGGSVEVTTNEASKLPSTTLTRERSESRVEVTELRIARLIIDKPCWIIVVWTVAFFVCSFLGSLVFEMGGAANHAYFVLSAKKTHRMDAMNLAERYIADNSVTAAAPKTQNVDFFAFALMYGFFYRSTLFANKSEKHKILRFLIN